jgi:hypothetical protein
MNIGKNLKNERQPIALAMGLINISINKLTVLTV